MAKLYEEKTTPPDLNKNTKWLMYPGVWTTYILILFFWWLVVLSVFGCSPGAAGTVVNLVHFAGTSFAEDQGAYNILTWWEQIDNGRQLTRNRKFFTVVPRLVLDSFNKTDHQKPMLLLNTITVILLLVAKCPNMHKLVHILGINGDRDRRQLHWKITTVDIYTAQKKEGVT